jgi:hypothetical protein
MSEPDVTLTDYALAIESAVLARLIGRPGVREGTLRRWFVIFFASTGAAPLFGGTVHGFFPHAGSVGEAILWRLTLLSIGVTALSGWVIGARLLFSGRVVRWITAAAAAELAAYALIVLFVRRDFRVAVINYLPAAALLLIAFSGAYRRARAPGLLWPIVGLGLTFVGAAIQQLRFGVPLYFNPNTLYHLIHALALFLIFWGARSLVEEEA